MLLARLTVTAVLGGFDYKHIENQAISSVTIFTAFQLCRYATKQIFKDKIGRLTQAVMMFTREKPNIWIKIIAIVRSQRDQFILFSVVFTSHPPSHHGSV